MGWQPPRLGTPAGCMLPFISLGPVVGSCHRYHGGCLFWGVTFWQSEKLFAAARNPRHRTSASPGPCVTSVAATSVLLRAPTSSAPAPSAAACQALALPQPFGCGAIAAHLGPRVLPSEPGPLTPLPGSTFPRSPSAQQISTLAPALRPESTCLLPKLLLSPEPLD